MNNFDFKKSTALITGGSRGIGKATAILLAQLGADIGVVARMPEALSEAAKEISTKTGQFCLALPADVSKYQDMQKTFGEFMEKFGRLDILVNCAGTHNPKGVLETSLDEWQEVIDVNLTGTFICCKLAAEIMSQQGSGHIINISSVQASRGGRSLQYTASKAGVEGLTRALARGLAHCHVRVNTVAPGGIETDFARKYWSPTTQATVERDSILGRIGQPEEIAEVIVFLVSKGASYITGSTVHVNGGLHVT